MFEQIQVAVDYLKSLKKSTAACNFISVFIIFYPNVIFYPNQIPNH